jgi:hypothetical protein
MLLCSCSLVRPRQLDSTPFLTHGKALVEKRERAPFNGIYVSDEKKWDTLVQSYSKIHFHEVNVEHAIARIKKMDLPPSIERQRIEELTEMARYLRERFKNAAESVGDENEEEETEQIALAEDAAEALAPGKVKRKTFMVVEERPQDGFLVDLALVEIVPTNPGIQALATIGGFFVPGGGAIRLLGTGSIAIEGVVKDGASGEVLFEFKDREADKTTLFSVKDYQQYAHARQTIEEWSMQFAEVATTTSEHMVDDALLVSVNPL